MKVLGQTIRVDFFSGIPTSLVEVTVGRFSVGVAQWETPGYDWNERGYDGLYHTWALYPLIQIEVFDKELHALYGVDEQPLVESLREARQILLRKLEEVLS